MPYQNLIEAIVEKCAEILAGGLTGIYLHGSLAMGCFNPDKSDIDLLVIVGGGVSDGQKMALTESLVRFNGQAPPKGIEISVVKREYCSPFVYPTPYELHFSPAHLQWFLESPEDYVRRMNGTDRDLAAHITVIRAYGIVLWGEQIEKVFAPVPRGDYIDSIFSDIEHAGEAVPGDPVYVILNLCRVLAAVRENVCLSKMDGGRWGMEHLPAEYHELIREALASYASDRAVRIRQECAVDFAEMMVRRIRESM